MLALLVCAWLCALRKRAQTCSVALSLCAVLPPSPRRRAQDARAVPHAEPRLQLQRGSAAQPQLARARTYRTRPRQRTVHTRARACTCACRCTSRHSFAFRVVYVLCLCVVMHACMRARVFVCSLLPFIFLPFFLPCGLSRCQLGFHDVMGFVRIPVYHLENRRLYDDWFPLRSKTGGKVRPRFLPPPQFPQFRTPPIAHPADVILPDRFALVCPLARRW